jgi:acetyl esterase/lipase
MKHLRIVMMGLCLMLAGTGMAQKGIVVNLWPQGAPNDNGVKAAETMSAPHFMINISTAAITVYPSAKPNSKAIIMCPGGAYIGECVTYEGHDMAAWFNSLGITYVVLKYRIPNGHYEVPLSDVHQAICLVREHCKEWNVNPNEVGIMGASAGGHLAATAANVFGEDTRPDFQILLYPVITMLEGTHQGSCDNLLGQNASKELKERYSMELQVSDRTPRAFIVLSDDDNTVPPMNSINYYAALQRHHVSASMHIYPTGGHGFGFQDKFIYKRQWTAELEKWLQSF